MNRRHLIAKALLALAAAVPLLAAAQAYPTKPVNLVVPYPAGGATDVIARMIADKLTPVWGQPVVVVNKPGAGTLIAAEQVARAPGDGYTLYMTTAAHTIGASLYKKIPYDAVKDFTPITLTSTIPLVLVTTPSLPVKSLSELIARAKADPGMSFASTGNGTPQHLTMELFKAQNKLALTHVPYKGDSPMLTDLIGGQVPMAFVTLSAAMPHIKAGKLRAIALAHSKRVEGIASVPTFAEAGMPGFVAATWFGLFGPGTLQPELANRIYRDVSKIVAVPEFTAKLKEMGGDVDNSTPQAFQAHIQAELKRWAEAVRLSGAQID
ncbi:tripartite tricarboxylate transporter substrate binding protein [Ramlibacter sp.]|uniref:tripartite tricarboxylate transporter substrate binding protein n=1 Tax=Ramlibacter sp. TaxID=1917967 RepID=UPI002BED0E86|nr:tripartite tricarboxylate transporter substrate binding protein [Ramlibacter sp.]HWI83708.1 tripartite tricarboxylate transporter substrate binding protein [Ramlibacter sp.]